MKELDACYEQVTARIASLLASDTDEVAAMATIACELYHSFDTFDWAGFYRVTLPDMLTIGPYQGTHGCLRIPFSKGVCGKCARENATQVVPDVGALPYHIACSSTTKSEIAIPVRDAKGTVRAVLDIDSNKANAFSNIDREHLEHICTMLGKKAIWNGRD